MAKPTKNVQLQIRVSAEEKEALRKAAKKAGLDMSEYVLLSLFPSQKKKFRELLKALAAAKTASYILAEIHDLFVSMSAQTFEESVAEPLPQNLSVYLQNYVAAMIEEAASQKGCAFPRHLADIDRLDEAVFGSIIKKLHFYLLLHSPLSFRRRNIFIDSSIGARV